MITVRKAAERGKTQKNWLTSFHTFSFADYYNPKFISFGNLLVINDDTVKPGFGFGVHSHHDTELISYVVDGSLEHQDSKGRITVLKPGDVQRMTAGTGISHSELNPSKTETLRFIQIWIAPNQLGLPPSYEQKRIAEEKNKLVLIASEEGGDSVVQIHQSASVYMANLSLNAKVEHNFESHHRGWVQVIKGTIMVNDQMLHEGDGAGIIEEPKVTIKSLEKSHFLLFDLATRH